MTATTCTTRKNDMLIVADICMERFKIIIAFRKDFLLICTSFLTYGGLMI